MADLHASLDQLGATCRSVVQTVLVPYRDALRDAGFTDPQTEGLVRDLAATLWSAAVETDDG